MGKWKGKPALTTGELICLHNDQDNLSKNSELKHLFLKHCNFLQFFSFLVGSGAVLAWPQQQPRSMVGGDAR